MNSLLENTLKKEELVRKKINKNEELAKKFSWVPYFAGEEFNQELAKYQEKQNKKVNIVDFSQSREKGKQWVEEKIREFHQGSENRQLVEDEKYPIIWFKNIEKITSGSDLENSLLPVFDPQQNTQLFDDKINLSNYILVATSSTREVEKLSAPLTSRLDCINIKTAEPKKSFLDKHYGLILFSSIFLVLILALLIFWPKRSKVVEE